MPFKRAFLYSVAINLFFLVLCLVFGDIKFGAIDDYFMAAVLTGAHGTDYNPHLLFVNAIYGYALLPLYHLFPKIGWYYIGEMTAVFVSFTAVGYVLLRRCGERWGLLLAMLFTAMFASDFYLVLQFTQCASILSAAGMLLFGYGVVDCRAPKGARNAPGSSPGQALVLSIGVVLLLWGSVMRWEAFLMGMPFFGVGLLFNLKQCWKFKWAMVVGFAVMFAGAYAMHNFDVSLYRNAEYAPYIDIQGPRVVLGDVSNYNQNAVYEDLEEMGKSGIDYQMLTEWTFYDTETFAVDSMQAIVDVIGQYRDKIERGDIPRLLLSALGHSLRSPLFWTWFIFCLLIGATDRKKFLYLWASLGVILYLMSMLLAMNRLVYRVESGFWLYAAVLAVPLWGRFRYELPRKLMVAAIAVIALANVFVYATSGDLVRGPGSGELRTLAIEDSTDYEQVFAYIDSQPDKMFLLSMNAYMRFSHHKNPPYLAEPIGSYRRTVSLGYWTPYLPEITRALAEFGVTNPMKDVVHDNVIVINEGRLKDFLQRHYYDSVAVDTLRVIGEMEFFKYRLVETDSAAKEAE
ncbi:hypothetical protein SAMN05720473_10287 [Fibrobacter sp. UWB15]|uniref:hypothetical protein n=1 Tax=unclassified Fibrobacter TaxID=2634177 RepID=UPI00091D6C54|nr:MULTISPECIES: hypothetical protein [unclassified Fibrobacter]PWJ66352.1 hypothetical protein BGW99_10287 [Fibrobacter sp. UWB6]SHG37059.1 hypothetical protein SAMN05720760_10987 [Fibrobacter sp. UWB8]SMG20514.1 hypothetical protein SAMN05720473_10287 [Fibrobacter sp. UWB15]